MAVTLDGNAVGNTVLDTCQSAADELHAAGIIGSGDTVLCHDQITLEIFRHGPDDILQRLGIEFVIHLG